MTGCVALVVAAGRGRRFGGEIPKQYRDLAGRPVLHHTLAAFAGHPRIDGVRAVIHPDDRDLYDAAAGELDLLDPVPGGGERQDSVRLGLESFEALAPQRVLIHDGARPLLDAATIDRTLDALAENVGAIAALPVADTLKREADGCCADTVDRSAMWRAQTPQGFHYDAILAAHRDCAGRALTDDAAVAEAAGLKVALVMGDEDNFKVTTEQDLARASRLRGPAPTETRVGTGFDVHRFAAGDHVMLAGVRIAHNRGLLGHSDADVAMHAVTDALLGAIGDGDIGSHFPPSDPAWKDAPSDRFLARARDLVVAERGGRILHVDLTLICEAPKIGPHRAAMRDRLAEILALDRDRLSVKATTTEGLGFSGRGEGIAAQAVATVELPR